MSVGEGVLFSDCRDQPVNYSLQFDPGTTHWDVQFEVFAADGTDTFSGSYIYSGEDPSSGTTGVQFCGIDDPGTYTLQATAEWTDSNYNDHPFTMAPVSFTMRAANTKTTATKTRLRNGNTRVNVRVLDERPNGYYPTDDAQVRLQYMTSGRWRTLPRSHLMAEDGKGSIVIDKPRKAIKIRAATTAEENYSSSYSRPLTIS